MRNFLIISSYTAYIFVFLGLVFHTSSSPDVLSKYTIPYFIGLLILFILFIPFLFLLRYLTSHSVVTLKKKKYNISPVKKISVFLVLIIAFIVIPAEIYLRLKYQHYETNSYRFTLDNFHPFLQFQLSKNNELPVNSYNFRGGEINREKTKNTYRIFVLGGSTVLNSPISYEKTLTRLLEDKLQARFTNKKIEVINAGNDGYTTEHSLIQYLFKIKDFDPDLIIMWHGINDWYYGCMREGFTTGSYKNDYSHYLGAAAAMARDHFTPGPVISIKLLSLDFLVSFLRDNFYSDFLNKKRYADPDIYNPRYAAKLYEMKDYPSLQTFRRNLRTIIQQTKSDNVAIILGNQPVLYSSTLNSQAVKKLYFPKLHCTVNGKYPTLKSVTEAMKKFNDATKQIAIENEVSFIDLDSSIPKTVNYFSDDVHYTEKGNEVIADVLFNFIRDNEFINDD